MISIGVQAPDDVQNDITTKVGFNEAFLAVTNIIFAYSTTPRTEIQDTFADLHSRPRCILRFHLGDERPS